ncbi:hypothetical protein BDZ89DRAFT_1229019 [Hymenopellis radicata]|nr:hypothetical protein BDZ89DRAFT_1229019 [Hymenopellis radicata]
MVHRVRVQGRFSESKNYSTLQQIDGDRSMSAPAEIWTKTYSFALLWRPSTSISLDVGIAKTLGAALAYTGARTTRGANSDCSAAPHDGNHFTIRTDNSNIVLWLTVNLPSWKEYDWEGDIQHKSFLRYIDALIENARAQASIEVSFLLVPSHREIAGQSGAMSLAGWASTSDKVPPEPEMKSFDERVYAVTLLELYTLSLQGISPTSLRVDVALKCLRKSRRSLKAAQRDKDTTIEDDVSSAPTEHDEVELLPTVNNQDRQRQRAQSDAAQQRDASERPRTSSHSEFSAPVRSSAYYAAHPEVNYSRNLGNLARICERLIPILDLSDCAWPQIPKKRQLLILDALVALLRDQDTNQEVNGGKRKAIDDAAPSHNAKKQKVTKTKAAPTGGQKRKIVDHIDVDLESIANRLCDQTKMALGIVFVVCEAEVLGSVPLLNYLPHLIGAANSRRKKHPTKLVRLPEGARKKLSEVWDIERHDVFAIETVQSTGSYTHYREWEVLTEKLKRQRRAEDIKISTIGCIVCIEV